ncbi:hypothetical protein HDV06_000734 [Boothiomyces sp. JEL0866]|nr:hypothetical protein HDV06_000734 [Boothiomyces sp. JEL0866]
MSEKQIEKVEDLEKNLDVDQMTELSDDDFEKQFGDLAMDFTGGILSTEDNVNTPALTIRGLFIATLFAIPLTFINTMASFRNNPYSIPSTIANILAYPIGIFFAAVLPDVSLFGVSLNPGPFSVKEHVLINIIVSASSSPPYGIDNVVAQKLFFGDDRVNFWNSYLFIFCTQFLGYGLAGLGRRFFIKPTAMLWPGVLGQVGFFNSFHESKALENPDNKYYHGMSRYTAFWLAFGFMFIYQWIPSFFATALTSVSVLCFFTRNRTVRFLGSAWYNEGPGILSFNFDWTYVGGAYSPMYVNWNSIFGNVLGMWIIAPLGYYLGAFGTPTLQPDLNYGGGEINSHAEWKNATIAHDPLPMYSSNYLYDVNGYRLTMSQGDQYPHLLDYNNNLNTTVFEMAGSKIYLSNGFAFSYLSSFMTFGAMFSQTFLFYGKDVYRQLKEALAQTESDLDAKDPHYKIMKNYKDISEANYLIFFGVLTLLTIVYLQFGIFYLPFWGTILAIFIAVLGVFPIGTITGITGVQPYLNIITELIAGLIFPGHTVTVMCFKSLGTNIMFQAVALMSDLKLGHYMHISPISMIAAQFIGTFYGSIINTAGSFFTIENIVNLTDQNSPWGAQSYQVFASAGGIWGALGPVRSFGPNSPYFVLNLGYLIGFLAPFIPWAMKKIYPSGFWNYVNMYIVVASMAPGTGAVNSGFINIAIVQIFVQWYLFKYQRDFWDKYVFSIQIALDTAAPLVSAIGTLLQTYVLTDPTAAQAGLFSPQGPYDFYCYGQTWNGQPSSF